jgi:hypothetical protein
MKFRFRFTETVDSRIAHVSPQTAAMLIAAGVSPANSQKSTSHSKNERSEFQA